MGRMLFCGLSFLAMPPAFAARGSGRFLRGWEQNSGVWVRSGGPQGLDPAVNLGGVEAGQITLATGARGTYAAWAQRHGRHRQIVAAPLTPRGPNKAGGAGEGRPVDPAPPGDEQLAPTTAGTTGGGT